MSKKVRSFLIGGVILIIVILLAVWSYLSKRYIPVPQGTVGNTAGNTNNGGYFCEYDGTVYFSNPYDSGALYAMSPDESNIHKLSAASVSYIMAGGKYLFYYQTAASGAAGLGYVRNVNGIYRCDLNGKHAANLTRELIFNMQLIGNDLYYLTSDSSGAGFYKLSADGKDTERLASTGWNFAAAQSDGTVYYNGTEKNHYLYRYNTASGTSSVVWEGNLWYPVYDNGYIYYLDVAGNYRLCRYSLYQDQVEILTHDRVDCFNLGGGYIYYQKNDASSPALMRITLDGQNPEVVMAGTYTHISITSRYVYFTPYNNNLMIYHTPVSGPVSVSTFSAAQAAANEAD